MDPKDFTINDWYTVLEGMSSASGVVAMSDVSGPLGLAKEALAGMAVLREGKAQTPFTAALHAQMSNATKEQQEALMKIAQEKQAALKGQRQTPEQAAQMALDNIRNAVQLVEEKAGAEAAAEYKQLILESAQKAAEASKEGGFLGIGGTLVSGKESQALAQIKAAVGL